MGNCFGKAQSQIIGRLHEHCIKLFGVFEIAVRCSRNGFHSSM